jgi:hypothetical protein
MIALADFKRLPPEMPGLLVWGPVMDHCQLEQNIREKFVQKFILHMHNMKKSPQKFDTLDSKIEYQLKYLTLLSLD